MTPSEEAKKIVSEIFIALRAYPDDVSWHERVRGGYHVEAGISGGVLTADVHHDGRFEVYAGKRDFGGDGLKPGAICLIFGSCAPRESNADQSVTDGAANREP